MREQCQWCGAPFLKGDSVDVGVGFMQMFADEPSCDCEDDYWKVKLYGDNEEEFEEENG